MVITIRVSPVQAAPRTRIVSPPAPPHRPRAGKRSAHLTCVPAPLRPVRHLCRRPQKRSSFTRLPGPRYRSRLASSRRSRPTDGARPLRRVRRTRHTAPDARPRGNIHGLGRGPAVRGRAGREVRTVGRGSGAWRTQRAPELLMALSPPIRRFLPLTSWRRGRARSASSSRKVDELPPRRCFRR